MNTRQRPIAGLIVSIGACLLVGLSGSLVTATSVREWYPLLRKPSWTPPDYLFGPVWTVLYLLMGVSAWLIWRTAAGRPRRVALACFAIQLALNAAWSFLFFGLRSPGWAAVEIVLLWCSIVATLLAFVRIDRLAAGLLLPYLLWVSYAAALNVAIWSLNSPAVAASHERAQQLDRKREDDGRVLLGGDLGQCLEVAQLHRVRLGAQLLGRRR